MRQIDRARMVFTTGMRRTRGISTFPFVYNHSRGWTHFVDRIYSGRSKLIRRPNKREFKATTMMQMEIESASGKIRNKHVTDEEEDYATIPARSALYPIEQRIGMPSECARQLLGLTRPEAMADFEPGARFDELMTRAYRRTFG
jgi:hypothetical protein